MSRQADARARTVAAVYPCAERCGRTADYECSTREIGERQQVQIKGVTQVVQPFVTRFLCEPCTKAAIVGQDPPPRGRGAPAQGEGARRGCGGRTCRREGFEGRRPACDGRELGAAPWLTS